MMVTLYHKKIYKGGFETPEAAADYYDKVSILVYGLEAKTNFNYSANQLR